MRRVLARLEHDRVAAQDGRKHLPRRHRDGEVPRRDEAADADGAPDGHVELVVHLRRHRVAEELAAHRHRVVRRVDGLLHVALGLEERLAHLARHRVRDLGLALRHEVADALEDLAALGRGHEAPRPEGASGGLDGGGHVRFARGREGADEVGLLGGVAALERLAAGGVAPLAVDVVLEGLGHGSGRGEGEGPVARTFAAKVPGAASGDGVRADSPPEVRMGASGARSRRPTARILCMLIRTTPAPLMMTLRACLFALAALVASGAAAQSPEAALKPGDWVKIETADSLVYGLVVEAQSDSLVLELDGNRRQTQALAYSGMDALAFSLQNPRTTGALKNMAKWSAITVGVAVVVLLRQSSGLHSPV